MGVLAGATSGGGEFDEALIRPYVKLANTYIRHVTVDINLTLRDMERKNLTEADEYKLLKGQVEGASRLKPAENVTDVENNMLTLMEIYAYLQRCTQCLLEKQIESVFTKYVSNA